MSSVVATEAGSAGRSRLIWVALALSLTLNIFFVGGLVWSRVAAPPLPGFAERLARIADDINLSPDQRVAFQQLQHTMEERSQRMRESNRPVFQQIWDQLGTAQPDQAVIARLIDDSMQNRRTYQTEVTAALGRFVAVLSPEQRAQFVELAKRPHDQKGVSLKHGMQ